MTKQPETRTQIEIRTDLLMIEQVYASGVFSPSRPSVLIRAAAIFLLIGLRDLIAKADKAGFVPPPQPIAPDAWKEVVEAIISCRNAACHIDSNKNLSADGGAYWFNMFVDPIDTRCMFGDYVLGMLDHCWPIYHTLKALDPDAADPALIEARYPYRPPTW